MLKTIVAYTDKHFGESKQDETTALAIVGALGTLLTLKPQSMDYKKKFSSYYGHEMREMRDKHSLGAIHGFTTAQSLEHLWNLAELLDLTPTKQHILWMHIIYCMDALWFRVPYPEEAREKLPYKERNEIGRIGLSLKAFLSKTFLKKLCTKASQVVECRHCEWCPCNDAPPSLKRKPDALIDLTESHKKHK